MENKKTKLTLSGIAKRSIKNIELAKTQSKHSVVIEKKTSKFAKFKTFYQVVIIHLLLIIHVFNPDIIIFNGFAYILVFVSLFLSVITGIQYIVSNFSIDN